MTEKPILLWLLRIVLRFFLVMMALGLALLVALILVRRGLAGLDIGVLIELTLYALLPAAAAGARLVGVATLAERLRKQRGGQ